LVAVEVHNAITIALRAFAGEQGEFKPLLQDLFVPFREHRDPEADEVEASLTALENERGL
jgi:hypothetical protein